MPSRSIEQRPIFLIGFPGTGKSTVGPILAARLNRRFVDLDAVIEEEAHATIAELFALESELGFRRREARLLRDVAKSGPQLVAVGGGAPCHEGNLDVMLAAGHVVCLTASLEELVQRLEAGQAGGRPLFHGARGPALKLAVEKLLGERGPTYDRAHAVVDTTGLAPSQVARRVAEASAWR